MLKGLSSILKKAVQVAAPIIGAATPLGPIFGAAAGSGLAGLLMGQKPKDALLSAGLAGLGDAKRAQPMDPADYMSAVDRRYGGQFARPPEEERIQNLNPIIQEPRGKADGGLMGSKFSYSAYDGSPIGIQTLADGGQTFPRKTGMINGPGGPKEDKIPAMLSDGEFVFTAKAVDNAGGPKAMYKMMNRLDPESERPN